MEARIGELMSLLVQRGDELRAQQLAGEQALRPRRGCAERAIEAAERE
ncbi:hypothetical protein [Novosphingobium colocasiae]